MFIALPLNRHAEARKVFDLLAQTVTEVRLVLDVPNQSTTPGVQLDQWTSNGGANQQWQFVSAGGGYYTLRGKGARLNQGLYRHALADCTHLTSSRVKFSDEDWQRIRDDVTRRVWQFIDGMRSGHFRVQPSLGRLTCRGDRLPQPATVDLTTWAPFLALQ